MTNIKKICDAMAALAAAIPGTSKGHHSIGVHLHSCDGSVLHFLGNEGARIEHYVSDDGTSEWECATLYVGDVCINAYSKHRDIGATALDPAAVDSALALAEEAVSIPKEAL